jgi:hypothetical protein
MQETPDSRKNSNPTSTSGSALPFSPLITTALREPLVDKQTLKMTSPSHSKDVVAAVTSSGHKQVLSLSR